MTTIFKIFFIFLILGISSSYATSNSTTITTPLSTALAEAEQFILQLKNISNIPAITFGLSAKGQTLWTKAWGIADLENDVPVNVATRFRLASLSKSFTSALIGSLADRHLVHYNDSVHKYLKESDFPIKFWEGKPVNITIGQLLSHTGGTFVGGDFDTIIPAPNITVSIRKHSTKPLLFSPGSGFAYSNYGFQLLGAVIESVTGKPYDVAMTAFIRSFGLNATVIETSTTPLIINRARYYRAPNATAPRENIPTALFDELYMVEAEWSDGNVVSKIEEMLKYGNLLLNAYHGRKPALVSNATIRSMWTSHTIGLPSVGSSVKIQPSYGYGWGVYNEKNKQRHIPFPLKHLNYVSHSGGAAGLTTWMNIYPQEEIVVVALCNKGSLLQLGQMTTYTVEKVADLV